VTKYNVCIIWLSLSVYELLNDPRRLQTTALQLITSDLVLVERTVLEVPVLTTTVSSIRGSATESRLIPVTVIFVPPL